MLMDEWLPQESKVQGFTVREVLDINLSSKHPNTGLRNWTKLRAELKLERARLKEKMTSLAGLFKDAALNILQPVATNVVNHGPHSLLREGLVVVPKHDEMPFKLVNRDEFGRLNKFTHLVKYWLAGGRRPARPSFLSRTKGWSKERRLARLDVLLARYLEHHYLLHTGYSNNGKRYHMYYAGELNQRTLNLFADVRKRIEDGR
jgi:hypothetical protein